MHKLLYIALAVLITSCNSNTSTKSTTTDINSKRMESLEDLTLNQEFKDYWYNGKAEISSYELSQSRYGEMRDGKSVMIFVTEPFNIIDEVKADNPSEDNRPVMKLNVTRDFNTGIYPYSIMSSTFLPLDKKDNAIKISSSIQEWCGHTYMQLNQYDKVYDVSLFSYFQSEQEDYFEVEQVMTENQIPIQLRIDPTAMPIGDLKLIPSLEYLRLKHVETKAYDATANFREIEDGYLYSVRYKELDRIIAFKTQKEAPYKILSWMERYNDNGQPAVSTGTLIKTLNTAYWSQKGSEYEVLRDSLQL
ncbi:septum formation inhibitor Maf [Nonlabens arenilitoris]|uniref:Septum formation inhibitor Maf n=1 Tax=Nonlabens arenilitoris TaxID=1217969 RepID=A0A2S7UD78_9FLAO|nr:septum formation inhibitor Maf [Nonlabens arenilitoris]PQJ32895.1 septum formation inhibitor Maf [Nonlabens arenilitoris]